MIFENASAGRNTDCRSVVNRASGFVAASTVSDVVNGVQNATEQCILRFQLIDAVHTRALRELKNAHNSVTVQNRAHVYMNFFHHKDLGNHLLQLCPKVVKHPVCRHQ